MCGSNYDMTGEWVSLEHEVERFLEALVRDLPGDERAVCEVGREESLADAADRARCEKGADALDYRLDRHAGAGGDFAEGVALEAFERVFRDGEDGSVYWIVEGKRYEGMAWLGRGGSAHCFDTSG